MSNKNTYTISLLEKITQLPHHFDRAAIVMDKLGVNDFAFFGGAVRDMIAGRKPSDINVLATMPRNDPFWMSVRKEIENFPETKLLSTKVFHSSGALQQIFHDAGLRFVSANRSPRHMAVKFIHAAKSPNPLEIDVNFNDRSVAISEKFPVAESPAHAMVLTRDGRLYGEQNSIEHAKSSIFEIRSGLSPFYLIKALIRYEQIRAKIPEMTVQTEIGGNSKLVDAWTAIDRLTGIPHKAALALRAYRNKITEPSDRVVYDRGFVNPINPASRPQ